MVGLVSPRIIEMNDERGKQPTRYQCMYIIYNPEFDFDLDALPFSRAFNPPSDAESGSPLSLSDVSHPRLAIAKAL